jgi:hypothetical protein
MTSREIEEKFRELAEPLIGERRASVVLDMVMELESLDSTARLGAALAAG